ncbi:type I polyketide synthase, partial [Streptomyces sp. 6N223]|uniref:type I polyketide synthase n=1 Tax=Streptomyces sp. 6N223 TaxID=3457412 RepID=UPI003FCF3399
SGGGAPGGAVAVIGVALRFPGGANDPDSFWRILAEGEDCVTAIRDTRPHLLADHQRDHGSQTEFPEHAGFTDGVDEFDAAFFGIAPLEAQAMDPQQRKLMELTWHLIEDSGYRPSALRGQRVGVYVGAHSGDYAELLFGRPDLVDTYGAYLDSGTHPALLANRVSRWYDFHGPSRVVNTACSSSLVALDAAVADLRAGTCDTAIVGGVNTLLSARSFLVNHKAGMQAGDGRCKTFDERADGYVRSEGYGAVMLKPLADAERDGDRIHGVIRGTAVNHDGQAESLRAPNPAAQKSLITAAYAAAGVEPRTVGYVETHGTGTALGDPIEVQALVDAFHELDPDLPAASCGLGSAKTSIGHLEAAAGIAGLIKLLLCMRHRRLPGLLHFTRLNPFIELDRTPFRVVAEAEPWERRRDESGNELPLRAGLSSFGFGGANAHAIVEEYPQRPAEQPPEAHGPELIVLSARDEDRLRTHAERLLRHLDETPHELGPIARTLRDAREEMPQRLAFLAGSVAEVKDALRRYLGGERSGAGLFTGNTRHSRDFAAFFREDAELRRSIDGWLASGNHAHHAKVLDLWVKGVAIDWSPLSPPVIRQGGQWARLPGYPFARDRHWFTDTFGDTAPAPAPGLSRQLHPLVHENVSDFHEERFRTRWSGAEFFLRDHDSTLPAAAWLEAARAAVALAHGADAGHVGVRLTDLSWDETYAHRPGAEQAVDISLMLGEDGLVDFDCYQRRPDADAEDPDDVHLYCQGRARLDTPGEPDLADPQRFTAGTEAGRPVPTRALAVTALRHGDGHWVAELSLPGALRPSAGDFVAHPALLAAALRVAEERSGGPARLAGIDEVTFRDRCDGDAYAVVTGADIDLRDTKGRLLVRLSGVRFRSGEANANSNEVENEIENENEGAR